MTKTNMDLSELLEKHDEGYVMVQGADTGKVLLADPEVRRSFLG